VRSPGSVRPTAVRFDADMMWVDLDDGRILGVPLAWFPRLLRGSVEARQKVTLSTTGLHWEELDEDISIAGLIAGKSNQKQAQLDDVG
jgi:hypothetical protein